MTPGGHARRCGGSPPGPVRLSLREVIGAGLSGSAEALAARTGWPPESVRAVLREMRREGEVHALEPAAGARSRRTRGRPAKVFAAASGPDLGPARTLAFLQTVWR